jgi:hypothetical protein
MPDVLESLATLAEHPPRPAPPVAEIRIRARAYRRRRRWTRVAAGLGLVAAVVAGGVLIVPEDAPAPVTASIDASHGPDGLAVLDGPRGLQVAPATGLGAHDVVRLTLDDDPGGELLVSQCLAGFADLTVRRRAMAVGSLCGSWTVLPAPADGGSDRAVSVQRRLVMSKATFDCGAAAGICVVAARPSGSDSEVFAPLSFAAGPPVDPTVQVVGEGPPYADRATVTVSGSGFAPDERLLIRQCRQVVPARSPGEAPDCDPAVRARVVRTADDGTFSAPFVVFALVATANGLDSPLTDWRLCGLCLLSVQGERSGTVATPLTMPIAGSPASPRIRIADTGPYAPGDHVRVVGSGFQPVPAGAEPAGPVVLAWCVTDAPGAECVALPGAAPAVGPDGGFVAEDVPLPAAGDEVFGTRCADAPGACSLAWSDGEEVVELGQMVALDLSG